MYDNPVTGSVPEVDVLLATWNGGRFLAQQLDSLFRQTVQDFRLVVRDDGSTDSTLEIVEQYRSRFPDRVVIQTNECQVGACRSFATLAERSVAPYVAFCDQDDIWREDRLAIGLAAAKSAEREYGIGTPILVFSDLTLIGERNEMLNPSMWKLMRVNPRRADLGSLLVQNLVTGCTVLANRSLLLRALPIPDDAIMHDSWLGLVAAAFGVLCPILEPTVLYRQHQRNAIGAKSPWTATQALKRLSSDQDFKQGITASRLQSQSFAGRFAQQLTNRQMAILEAWSRSQELPPVVRQWTLYRNGLRRTSLLNNLVFLARV